MLGVPRTGTLEVEGGEITNEENTTREGRQRRAAFEYQDAGAPMNVCRAPLGRGCPSARALGTKPSSNAQAYKQK